jgi:hypothetical protein
MVASSNDAASSSDASSYWLRKVVRRSHAVPAHPWPRPRPGQASAVLREPESMLRVKCLLLGLICRRTMAPGLAQGVQARNTTNPCGRGRDSALQRQRLRLFT